MHYVISDLHGEYDLFIELLSRIGFGAEDTLYVCGDIVDKGLRSVHLLDAISKMPNAKVIAGNHEYAFLKHYWGLMQSAENYDAVLEELKSYFEGDGALLSWELVDWMEALPYSIEEEEFVCVHAGIPFKGGALLPLSTATPEQLVYDRVFKEPEVGQGAEKCVFFGHTPTSYLTGGEGKILAYRRAGGDGEHIGSYYKVHLDTGVWLTGVLGCFCVETCRCYYVKKRG